jgi:hypothetical protein
MPSDAPIAASEPLSTWKPIALQARAQVSISSRRSALMRPARWRSMRNRVRAGLFAAIGILRRGF